VYLSSRDDSARLCVKRWDGSSWSALEALTTPTAAISPPWSPPPIFWENPADAPCLSGASGFLTVRHNVGEPEHDPDYGSTGMVSNGGPWHELLDHGEPGTDGLRAVQLGPADAPLGLFTSLQPPEISTPGDEQRLHYDIPDPEQPDQILESGSLDHAFIGAIAGQDLDHMVGVVEVDGVMHFVFRDGGAWQTRGKGAVQFGGRGAAWYGTDAIGVADDDGVTLCKR
jgi:hypothetical protein